jgi:hypothetical protein
MGTKNLNSATDLITFTRASGGTFLGSNGLIQTATNNVPRIEYDATGAVKGLLIEEARTNKYKKSSLTIANTDISTWGVSNKDWWVSSGIFTSFSNVPTPDGGSSSTRVYSTGAADWITTNQNATGVCSNGQIKSIWARTVSGTGTVGLLSRYANAWSETSLTEEWQRFEVAVDTTGDSEEYFYLLDFRVGNLTEALIWGAQLEEGDFASSYIPTNGSEVTRAMDVASIPTSAFGYNNDKGSIAVEFNSNKPNNEQYGAFGLSDGSPTNRIAYYATSVNTLVVTTAGVGQVELNAGLRVTTSELVKFSAGYAENDFAASLNGATTVTDTSGTVPSGISSLAIGHYYPTNPSSNLINGHIKSIKYYPRRLTNTQLQELTT